MMTRIRLAECNIPLVTEVHQQYQVEQHSPNHGIQHGIPRQQRERDGHQAQVDNHLEQPGANAELLLTKQRQNVDAPEAEPMPEQDQKADAHQQPTHHAGVERVHLHALQRFHVMTEQRELTGQHIRHAGQHRHGNEGAHSEPPPHSHERQHIERQVDDEETGTKRPRRDVADQKGHACRATGQEMLEQVTLHAKGDQQDTNDQRQRILERMVARPRVRHIHHGNILLI
ncbi:aspartyl/asparaginyl-tRNA synthetases [Zymobacter palmae]|uniref:Aspartyl/asparaginyl-tRNA synthetases n=1 Tax=Zymobacter palmae TaxID=33074 RepID=A0A348HIF3_9GAMM|nr:aspartyl/asparaginyl-tRNA synthetases [Zymobacter palmae]